MRPDVERLGTVLVVLVTLLTLLAVGVSGSLKMAGADLHTQVDHLRGGNSVRSVLPIGQRLSAVLARDVAPGNVSDLNARAFELDHRADRLLEMTAVVALIGMLVALVTTRPTFEVNHARDANRPLARTSSNGTV